MGYIPFKTDYLNMPVVTRLYLTLTLFATLAVQFGVISKSQIHFSYALIFKNYEFHRLFTNVLFLGYLGFNWAFQYVFLYKYCKKMEESFEGRNMDFICMILFNGAFITIASSYFELAFIGQSFVLMFVFVWSRRFRKNEVDLFGIVQYPAYLLPWIIMLFFVLMGNPIILDLIGIGSGLAYILVEDVLSKKLGFRILHIPGFCH